MTSSLVGDRGSRVGGEVMGKNGKQKAKLKGSQEIIYQLSSRVQLSTCISLLILAESAKSLETLMESFCCLKLLWGEMSFLSYAPSHNKLFIPLQKSISLTKCSLRGFLGKCFSTDQVLSGKCKFYTLKYNYLLLKVAVTHFRFLKNPFLGHAI